MRLKQVSRLSAYARAESHLVQQTFVGAAVTVCGVLLALTLFTNEMREYLAPFSVQTMSVDGSRDHYMRMHFNITYPSLPCQVLSMDAMDMSGESSAGRGYAINGEIHKIRLNAQGERIGLGEYIPPRRYGFLLGGPRQDGSDANAAMEGHEGCNIYGWLDLQRLAGNFRISVRVEEFFMLTKTQESIAQALQAQLAHMDSGGMHAVQLSADTTNINSSHIIHRVAFGPIFPGQVNPLDGFERVLQKESGTFKYYLKLVPTEYIKLDGSRVKTNQYSVTEYDTPVHKGEMQMPAVWFIYDISPITATITESMRSFAHLLTRICAVVGGVFAVTGAIDRWVHRLVTAVSKRL